MKYRVTPKRIEATRQKLRRNKKWETGGGGLAQVADARGKTIFIRDWLAHHDRHMGVFQEVWEKLVSGDWDGAERQLAEWLRKWEDQL